MFAACSARSFSGTPSRIRCYRPERDVEHLQIQSLSGVLLLRAASRRERKKQAENLRPVPGTDSVSSPAWKGSCTAQKTQRDSEKCRSRGFSAWSLSLKLHYPFLGKEEYLPHRKSKKERKIQSLPFLTIQKETDLRTKPSAGAD